MYAVIYTIKDMTDEDHNNDEYIEDWCLAESKEEAAHIVHTLIEHFKNRQFKTLDGWGICEIVDSDKELWIQKRDLGLED
tara:strand:+ start:117 stop:356 length:240 start_codon:yes stop_codon:yes gene_type:complete